MPDFSTLPGASPDLLGLIQRLGWPLTKASYVAAMFFPETPELPLDAETLSRVPVELPGALPSSSTDLSFPVPTSLPPADSAPSSTGRPPLPEPLIASVMQAYGFTREAAIEELEQSAL